MSENSRRKNIFDVKAVFCSLALAFVFYLIFCFGYAVLINFKYIPYDYKDVYSKFSYLLCLIISCFITVKKGRGEPFINSISCATIIFAAGVMTSVFFEGKEWDTFAVIICILITCLSCTLSLLRISKNSKLHKRKRKQIN